MVKDIYDVCRLILEMYEESFSSRFVLGREESEYENENAVPKELVYKIGVEDGRNSAFSELLIRAFGWEHAEKFLEEMIDKYKGEYDD